jgi:hypothetical protein
MDRVFHTHTAQADMQAKQDIFDLLMPSNSSRTATLEAAENHHEKALKASETRIEHKV